MSKATFGPETVAVIRNELIRDMADFIDLSFPYIVPSYVKESGAALMELREIRNDLLKYARILTAYDESDKASVLRYEVKRLLSGIGEKRETPILFNGKSELRTHHLSESFVGDTSKQVSSPTIAWI